LTPNQTKPKLSRAVLVNITLVAAAAILVLGAYQIFDEYRNVTTDIEKMRAEYLADCKALLREQVSSAVDYIHYMRLQTETRLRDSIRSRVDDAIAIADHLLEHYGSIHNKVKLQELVREALRPIRFNQGRGYYFAFDLNGVEQLFADRPELEGQNMLELRGGQGEFVVRDMIELARKSGSGFYQYNWTKPGDEGNKHPKIAYVKLCKPLNWIIGTGEYRADVEEDIKKEIIARVEEIRYEGDNYVFISDWDGYALTEPGKGKNNLNVKDFNGLEIVKKLIALAKTGGGYLTYVMPKFEGLRNTTKLSYVTGIPEWRWYVGSGVYVDEIEAEIAIRRQTFRRMALVRIGVIISILVLMIGLAYLMARRFANRTRADYDRFENFFSSAASSESELDPAEIHFAELAALAESANRMVEARSKGEYAQRTLERFFQISVDLLCIADLEGRFIRVNPAFEQTLGYTAAELTGQPYITFVHPDDKEKTMNASDQLTTGQPVVNFQNRYRCADGSYRWLDWTSQPVPEEGVTYAIVRDVTRQNEIEQELHSLADIAKSIPSGLFIYQFEEPDRLILIDSNPAAFKLTGIDSDQWRGREFNEIWPNAKKTGISDHFLKVARQGRPWETEDTHYKDERLDAAYRIRVFPLPNKRLGVAFEDITDRKKAEFEQAKLQELLHHSQKMEAIGTLAGGIAHDFNNILGAILGYAEIAHNAAEGGQVNPSDVKQIITAAERARSLVQQILTFSRKVEPERKAIQINQEVGKAIELLEHTLPKMITTQLKLSPTICLINADPNQLSQLILNLATNAHQAMPDGGQLTISTENSSFSDKVCAMCGAHFSGDWVSLSITDTGHGIDPQDLPKIFDPFYTTKEVGKGTGLGLATVHGIVLSHGGHIECNSQLGKGTTFTIYFPVKRDQVQISAGIPSPDTNSLPGGSETILMVDDEESLTADGEPHHGKQRLRSGHRR
jgi:two-component system cell cycle sensor histidine kinase/response regulator CckA